MAYGGEDGGGGNSLPQVGCGGSPPEKVGENCINI